MKFSIHFWGTYSVSVPQLWRDRLLFKGFQYYFRSMHPLNWSHIGPTGVIPMLSLCKTWIDVLKFSIHFWGTSSVSVPQLWRDSLLFKWFQYYFHSMHPLNWSHIGPTGVIPMLSLCKTLIDVLKISIHFWGTSSVSVPQLWRDSLLFKILVLLSFITSNVTKSHRANRCYPDAFIVQDLNRCTEIQYSLLGHFFSFSTTAVKR